MRGHGDEGITFWIEGRRAGLRPVARGTRPASWMVQLRAERPNQLWVSYFTYASTCHGWLYVAFVIDVFARRIVGWRVSTSMQTDFVLDALEQALYDRQPKGDSSLIHHLDRGSQSLIQNNPTYTEFCM